VRVEQAARLSIRAARRNHPRGASGKVAAQWQGAHQARRRGVPGSAGLRTRWSRHSVETNFSLDALWDRHCLIGRVAKQSFEDKCVTKPELGHENQESSSPQNAATSGFGDPRYPVPH